jgi:hypothetical protein
LDNKSEKQGHGHTGPKNLAEDELKWQVRINLSEDFAKVVRQSQRLDTPSLRPLNDILDKYDAKLKHQQMAFADFVPQFKEQERPELRTKLQASLKLLEYAEDNNDIDASIEALKLVQSVSRDFVERTRLCLWTEDTLRKPGIEEKYANRFTVYADGGKEVYDKAVADGLVADLQPLVDQGTIIKGVDVFDSDPAHNPQAPRKFHA